MAKGPAKRGQKGKKGSTGRRYYRNMMRVVTSEYAVLSMLGVFIGILSAIGAWFFRMMVQGFNWAFMGTAEMRVTGSITDFPYGPLTFLAPIIGGLMVGLILFYLAPEMTGGGMPAVIESVAVRGGRIKARVIALKALVSSIAIGSGGSVGREGPIVHIGAAIGSTIGQRFKMPEGWTKILVACGATGAVTATFNTPIAGVILALELVLIELKTRSFIPLVVTSVFAKIVSIQLLGDHPAFELTEEVLATFKLVSVWEFLIYLLLGLLAGLTAVLLVKSMDSIENLFDRVRMRPYLKPMVGGLIIALIALVFPQVLGVGYETVNAVLTEGNLMVPLYLMLVLIFIKIIATSVTIGSGSSGGVFSPSLFIGVMLGGAVGAIANDLFPNMTGPVGAYAIVGMAAVFAGAGRATFTSMIMIFEMTLNYDLILPVMFACVVSDGVSSILMKESIFTRRLAKKGIRILHDMEVNLLEAITVKEAMVAHCDVYCVSEDETIGEVYSKILKTEHMGFPVMNKIDKCVGIITFHDIDRAMSHGYVAEPARWFCTRRPVVTYQNETLEDALQKMQKFDISHLPVVSRRDKRKLRGFITKGDVLKTYAKRHVRAKSEKNFSLFGRKKRR